MRRTVDDHLVVVEDDDIPPHIAIAEAMRHDLPWDAPDLADALDELCGQPVVLEVRDGDDPARRATRLVRDLLARRGGIDDVEVV
ncbi:MAG TPA: hypothetical protein VFU93_10150 [Acidimicrobiales bacterium]|nr:hypothetical protein [Acidimicrobiales bacterium]